MSRSDSFWQLELFENRYQAWLDTEQPPQAIRAEVLDWIDAMWDDAYGAPNAIREPTLGVNVWFARLEMTYFEDTIVTCVYQIIEETRTVRCWTIATLSLPI